MKPKIYIDGQAGTTGLEIYQRLSLREDIEILEIDPGKRKDEQERKKLMNEADLVFLCLPDDADIKAVSLIENEHTKVIDASTAHRTLDSWVYGMPELNEEQRQKIKTQRWIANPGCHATGFILGVYPLVQNGAIKANQSIVCFSLTGYSGGGKKMIEQYEKNKTSDLMAPRIYGLNQMHKHLPEMKKICGLEGTPVFYPVVSDYYRGMATTISIENHRKQEIYDILNNWYKDSSLIHVSQRNEGMISGNEMAKKDSVELIVYGNDTRVGVTVLFDNLGKGACGAAIQNMNLMLGFNEWEGLNL